MSHDDVVLREMTVEGPPMVINAVLPPKLADYANWEQPADITDVPTIRYVEFHLDRRETAFAQLLEPRALIYRQRI